MDRKLAERRLKELKDKIGVLRVSDDAKCDFKTLAGHWLDSRRHKLAGSTAEWYGYFIKNLGNFFGAASIRNITAQDCERWEATRRKTCCHTFSAARLRRYSRNGGSSVRLAARANAFRAASSRFSNRRMCPRAAQ